VELAALVLDIALENRQWCTTGADDTVCPMPEYRFGVVPGDGISKFPPDLPGADSFEGIYETARLDIRVSIHEQMHVIGFAVKLYQFTTCICTYPFKVLP